jgi:hypothetical protein
VTPHNRAVEAVLRAFPGSRLVWAELHKPPCPGCGSRAATMDWPQRMLPGEVRFAALPTGPDTRKTPSVELDALNEEDGVAATDPR